MFNLGIIGWPLEQSLSPRIHSAALSANQLAGAYELYPIPPASDGLGELRKVLNLVRDGEIDGLNVTIPHKRTVIDLLDKLTPVAQAVGAVNTIYQVDQRLIGHNTDAAGFLLDLMMNLSNSHIPQRALVMGGGGASRAVVYSLAQSGWHVFIAARRVEQSEQLIKDFMGIYFNTSPQFEALELSAQAMEPILADCSLIVNATSAGMIPNVDGTPWPEGLAFPPQALVYDLIYKPRETHLMRDARAAGLTAVNGLGMLIEQAALSFEKWTGFPAHRDQMWRVIAK